jgi:hypothetical protein
VFTTFVLPGATDFGAQLRFRAGGIPVTSPNTAVNTNISLNITASININLAVTTTVLFLGCPVTIVCTTGLCGVSSGVCPVCQPLGSSQTVTLSANQPLTTQAASQPLGGLSVNGSSNGGQSPSDLKKTPISTVAVQLTTSSGTTHAISIFICFVTIAATSLLV